MIRTLKPLLTLKPVLTLKPLYFDYLSTFLSFSVSISLFCGVTELNKSEVIRSELFRTIDFMFSYTTFGILFGLLYPVSFPLCAGYTLYKTIKHDI